MKRIAQSTFPGKFAKNSNLRYIAVPSSVVERMGLIEGDYLDVTISWPKTEEYAIDEPRNAETVVNGPKNKSKSRRKTTEDEE